MTKEVINIPKRKKTCEQRASLTVEAALVMPIFLYFMIAFLYIIQIFSLKEHIQSEITKMGLNWSKTAYFYEDFPDIEEALSFDKSLFGVDIGLGDVTDKIINGYSLKLYAKEYLDKNWINYSCIQDGFEGIDFNYSEINDEEDCIDIVLKYKISIPVKIFIIGDINILQRVRLRNWTGYEVAATYETEAKSKETIVFITYTGSVYHKNKNCVYLKPSVVAVQGIPNDLRNESGEKYSKCKYCCTGPEGKYNTYYITKYGNRYHSNRTCSRIYRNIKEIPLSEAGNRKPCSKCGK